MRAICPEVRTDGQLNLIRARHPLITGTPDVPRPDNLHLAERGDAVSTNPCEIRPEYLQTWAEMGDKYLPCRSIGYDHIPLDTAK